MLKKQPLLIRYFLLAGIFFSPIKVWSQLVISESDYQYKRDFAPYEVSNIVGLPDQQMIFLLEDGKRRFRLIRYDEYFFEKWSTSIEYKRGGSFPKLLLKEDKAIIFRFWAHEKEAFAEVRTYSIHSGQLISEVKETILKSSFELSDIKIKFSEDLDKFVIYNYWSDDSQQDLFEVYDSNELQKRYTYQINVPETLNKKKTVYLNSDGELFVAVADEGTFNIDGYFFDPDNSDQPIVLNSSFTFQRPANTIQQMFVVKQSISTYSVILAANIDEEMVGMNITSFNVVLNSVLFSNSYDLDEEFILETYFDKIITTENQRSRFLEAPEDLSNFYMTEIYLNSEGEMVCMIENQEFRSEYHELSKGMNKPLKWKETEDVYYECEDIILVNLSSVGEIIWNKVIHKTQSEKGKGLGLSYFSKMYGDTLRLVTQEEARGDSFYRFDINTSTGELINRYSFIDKNLMYNKNYSGWIDERTLVICGYPANTKSRAFYLVEF